MKTEHIKKHRLFLLFCFLVYVTGVAGYVFWSNRTAEKGIYRDIDQRLFMAAQGLKYMLAPDFHDRAVDETSIAMEEELKNRRAMTDFGTEAGFKWVYTLVEKEGRFYFSAPSVSEEEAKEREHWYFYPYEDVPPGFVAALKENRIVYTTYRDQWGYFRSVALPQVSPGGRRYLACADYEVTYIQKLSRQNYIRSLAIAVYFLLFSVPFILAFRKIWGAHTKEIQDFNTALLEHKNHLEELVRERTKELERSNQELKQYIAELKKTQEERLHLESQLQRSQKLEAIGILAGGVAHDLNNILTGLVSYPELLLLELPPESPLRHSIQLIRKSGEKAAAVVQDLLTLARGVAIVRESVDLNEIVRELMQTPEYERLLYYHPDIRVEIDLEEEVFCLAGSAVHVSKVLMNLAANAIEAMPAGGTIRISTGNRRLDQALDGYEKIPSGDYVLLSVTDTGAGIASQDLARIFEPFYTKKVMSRSGSGLGLSVVWGTVKDHKGYMDVQSTPEAGTRMDVYFPVSRTEIPQEGAEKELAAYAGSAERILVVDDVELQRTIAQAILVKLGYEVHAVASGEEAIEYLRASPVDLVLLDPRLPEFDAGKALVGAIRHGWPATRIVALYWPEEHPGPAGHPV
ncbi:MAG: response regulator, partial [Desulfobacteraceae bacterium]